MAAFGVLSVDYRRPPEHRHPAALDDAVAGVVADLHVYEAQAHASYMRDVPERQEAFEEVAKFFDEHLAR